MVPLNTELMEEGGSFRVGDLLRRRRMSLRMTQSQLAQAIGMPDDGTVAAVERGQAPASEVLLRNLAKALDISWSEIESLNAQSPTAQQIENPYRGLLAFRESDADLYFGRTASAQLVIRKLDHT